VKFLFRQYFFLIYIDSESIRPMPRAYDRIVNVLGRINEVRDSIEKLNQTLEQVSLVREDFM
jgi:hypothetical protein